MEWCSHCVKSANFEYAIGTEFTFWVCADCGKILGSVCMVGLGKKRRLERDTKETLARMTQSSSTEVDGVDHIHLTGSVKKGRLKRARRSTARTTESSSTEDDAAD